MYFKFACTSFIRIVVSLVVVFCMALLPASAQENGFDPDAYKNFQEANAGMSAGDLMLMHPAGTFERNINASFQSALYNRSLQAAYNLTSDEINLINKHGFVVSERLTNDSFGNAFHDIYAKDLPVFISTDAVLHALHMSYNDILQELEERVLISKLESLLAELKTAIPELDTRYSGVEGMEVPLRDLDLYINIAQRLLAGEAVSPVFTENVAEIDTLMAYVESEEGFVQHDFFAENCRLYDFSQFTPRGHYTNSEELTKYFQSLIWLGRTEMYLTAPKTQPPCKPSDADVQRQTILAMLVTEAIEASNATTFIEEMETLIQLFVGESDNVTFPHMQMLRTLANVTQASDLLDEEVFKSFQETLLEQAWSMQRIQSQMLVSGRTDIEETKPASAFLLMGQRFVIDSYVTGLLVFDKLSSNERRMLPDPLDVLFALGNDAAAQLLEPEITAYNYATDLASLRYVVDSYEDEFWDETIYNGWLNTIRTLNPPEEVDRSSLPKFMQTAAWWQEKMNTQLAGWSQLRHDNLLYAKQSYSAIPLCSFPHSYVEPIPAFYEAASTLGNNAVEKLRLVDLEDQEYADEVISYFETFAGINDTLAVIAQKELDGSAFNAEESSFLARVIFDIPKGCYRELKGWYTKLYYNGEGAATDPEHMVIADIHTAPANAAGGIVGWVFHVGTGPVNMAIVTAEVPGAGEVAFMGPVMSYYEHVSSNFERLTDEVWATAYDGEPSYRPEFVNLYLAGKDGETRGNASTLSVGVENNLTEDDQPLPAIPHLGNYPNPFQDATSITFSVPLKDAQKQVELTIYDVQGRVVGHLVDEALPAGHYSIRWDGTLDSGTRAASGIYYSRLRIGDQELSNPMAIVK